MGHSYIVYAPLLQGCTTVLFEGKPVGTPDASTYWRVCADNGVHNMFTAPTALRAIRREDPQLEMYRSAGVSELRTLFVAGERGDPDTISFFSEAMDGVAVVDNYWQTETGWPISGNCVGLGRMRCKPGSAFKPVPGYDVRVLEADQTETEKNTDGSVCIRLPMPPGCLPTLWNNDERFKEAYLDDFPGFYKTGDAGHMDDDGYLSIMTRTDDIINVSGHRCVDTVCLSQLFVCLN